MKTSLELQYYSVANGMLTAYFGFDAPRTYH